MILNTLYKITHSVKGFFFWLQEKIKQLLDGKSSYIIRTLPTKGFPLIFTYRTKRNLKYMEEQMETFTILRENYPFFREATKYYDESGVMLCITSVPETKDFNIFNSLVVFEELD